MITWIFAHPYTSIVIVHVLWIAGWLIYMQNNWDEDEK